MSDVPEEENFSFREAQCIPGNDPDDINRGSNFVFLFEVANERMRRNKRKVRYVFQDEEEKEQPEEAKEEVKADLGPGKELVDAAAKRAQIEEEVKIAMQPIEAAGSKQEPELLHPPGGYNLDYV